MQGDQATKLLLQEDYTETYPQISPDGRWMAYQSNEEGQVEIYVRPFPDVNGGKWKVSTRGGEKHRWSSDGQELFYWTDDALMVVAVESEPAFNFGTPEVLLQRQPFVSYSMGAFRISWDNHPDNQRFLMIKHGATEDDQSAAGTPRKINIILNWFEELKQKVPTDRLRRFRGRQIDRQQRRMLEKHAFIQSDLPCLNQQAGIPLPTAALAAYN